MDALLSYLSPSTTVGAIQLANLALDASRANQPAFTSLLKFFSRWIHADRLAVIIPENNSERWVTYASFGKEAPEPGTAVPKVKGKVLDFLRDGAMMFTDPTKGIGWDFYVSVYDDMNRLVGIFLVDDSTCARQFTRDENRDLQNAAGLFGKILGNKVPALEMRPLDSFTGLATPRAFEERLPRLILSASDRNECVWFVSADPDRLRSINEEAGTEVGDQVVHWMADALKRSIGREDIAARWNGAWLMAAGTGERGLEVGMTFHELIGRRQNLPEDLQDVRMTVSVGASEFEPKNELDSVSIALERAEAAMLRAKQLGGSHVLFGHALESATAK